MTDSIRRAMSSMNVLSIFEQRISAIFEEDAPGQRKPFSFKRLAKRCVREMEDETFVIDGVDTAPALYTVLVSAKDDELMRPMYARICDEVSQLVEAQAKKRGYTFVGRPLVRFMVDPALRAGKFSVFAENVDPRTLARLRDEENAYLGLTPPKDIPFGGGFVPEQLSIDEEEPAPVASKVDFAVEPDVHEEENLPEEVWKPAFFEVEEAVEDLHGEPNLNAIPSLDDEDAPVVEDEGEFLEDAPEEEVWEDDAPEEPFEEDEEVFEEDVETDDEELVIEEEEDVDEELATEEPVIEDVAKPAENVTARGAHYRSTPEFPEPLEEELDDNDEDDLPDEFDIMAEEERIPMPAPMPMGAPATRTIPRRRQKDTCTLTDKATGRTYQVIVRRTPIGRERMEGGIVLRDPNVSRRHAELLFDDGVWMIRDLNSTNGTLVDDMDVHEAVLTDGDVITIGLTNLEFKAG